MSSGINIPQVVLALVEGYAVSESMKKSLIYGVSVGLSNLMPGDKIVSTSAGEKYVAEPVVAGLLSALGAYMLKTEGSKVKYFTNGFLIGSSSAAVINAGLNYKYRDDIKNSFSKKLAESAVPGTDPFIAPPTTAYSVLRTNPAFSYVIA